MVKKILASDILIADMIIPIKNDEQIAQLKDPSLKEKYNHINKMLDQVLDAKKVKRGQKVALTKDEFNHFSKAVAGLTNTPVPGGSSANTLTTLSKLLGKHVDIDFLGVVNDGVYSNMIKGGLEDANINLIPKIFPAQSPNPQAALSFVFTASDGSRTIATYPGNAKEILTPDMVTPEMVGNSDVLFVQGSLWEKFDKAFVDNLVTERWNQDKEIWLALPTHAKFSDTRPPEAYQYLIPSADVVLGNDEELMRIYKTDNIDEAISKLQAALAERNPIKEREGKTLFQNDLVVGKAHHKKKAVAFITRGAEGAVVVTPEKIDYVKPGQIDKSEIVNTLGAGDTSFAGFLAGHVAGLAPTASANFAMQLATEKLKVNGARLDNPLNTVENGSRAIQALWKNIKERLHSTLSQVNGQLSYAR